MYRSQTQFDERRPSFRHQSVDSSKDGLLELISFYLAELSSLSHTLASTLPVCFRSSPLNTTQRFLQRDGKYSLGYNTTETPEPLADYTQQFSGWLTLCNLCLTMFLALKNTPLSPLTGHSYESVNVLHRCAGYTTIVAMLLHSSVYIQSLVKSGSTFLLMMPPQYAAVYAGFCLVIIGVTASSPFRKRQYELFFMIHVTMVTGILIARKFTPYIRSIQANTI